MTAHTPSRGAQVLIGAGALVLSALLAWGASGIPSEAGYAGVGPSFLPWVVSMAMGLCGLWLLLQALTGGFRDLEPPSGAARGDWRALAWVAGGIAANALLIERAGFIVASALCYALAVHGLRSAEGRRWGGPTRSLLDIVTGMLIATPVYWLFTQVLQVNLPGLTASGWI
jgi:putative tricarboxylic transport membrane protein